jgi:hypothetical protein
MPLFIVILLLFVASFPSMATDYYVLNDKDGCYVKEYVSRKFKDVDYDKFKRQRLFARPHKRNKKYMVFKSNDKIYITRSRCLEDVNAGFYDPDELIDSAREEDYRDINRKVQKHQLENLGFVDNKWFLELDFGMSSFNDNSQIYPDYTDFSGVIVDELGNTYTVNNGKAKNSKYKGGSLISFSGGYRYSDTSFFTLKFKHSTGKKTDKIDAEFSGDTYETALEYEDTLSTILIGNKFIFLPNSRLRPTLGLYAGISIIDSEMGSIDKIKFRSTGLAAQVDLGLEYFFTNHFALGISVAYEYLGSRTFRVVDSQDETNDYGFKSEMSYSNISALAGLKVYFR